MKNLGWILIVLLMFPSCDRIKNKGEKAIDKTKETVSKAKQKIGDKKDQFVEGTFPPYDSDIPDTKSNKKRFKEHLLLEPSNDVRNIYAYSDFLGVDYKVLIAFICDQSTIDRMSLFKRCSEWQKTIMVCLFLMN